MNHAKRLVCMLAVSSFLLGLFGVTCANAATSAEHAAHHEAAGISSLFFPAVNFAMYFGVLVWAYKKTVRPALHERSLQIESDLKQAVNILGDVNQRYEDLSDRLVNIESEQTELKKRMRQEGEKLAETLLGKAQESAEAAGEDAQRRMEGEREKAIAEIRREVVRSATKMAREKLKALSESDDQRLRQEALRGML